MVKKEDIESINRELSELQIKYSELQKYFDELKTEIKTIKKENSKLNNNSKKDKKINGPKKNSNAYIHFCNEYRKNHPNEKVLIKLLSKEWNNIKNNKEMRNKYDVMAKEDKERYNNEVKNYKSDTLKI